MATRVARGRKYVSMVEFSLSPNFVSVPVLALYHNKPDFVYT